MKRKIFSNPESASTYSDQNNLLGAIHVVLCCMMLAAAMLMARSLGPQIAGEEALHPVQITWARYCVAAVIIFPIALSCGHSLISVDWRLHAGRIGSGAAGIIGLFAAAGLMALSDATAISFLSPLFTMVFAVFFLRENVGPWRWGAAFIAFAGAIVITRPGSDAFQPAALIALAAAAFMGAELIFIKALSSREAKLKILMINNIGATLLMSAIVPFFWKMPVGDQWILILAIGPTMLCAQILFLKGIALAEANVAAPFFYTTLIFATLYGWIIFSEIPGLYTILGSSLIIGGAALLTWRERVRARADRKY